MDEVDIDNAEDLNELEARLYAQIHHEASETPVVTQDDSVEQTVAVGSVANGNTGGDLTSEATNRSLAMRYWASGQIAASKVPQQSQQNSKYRVRNQHKASTVVLPPKINKEVENLQKTYENINNIAGEDTTLLSGGIYDNSLANSRSHSDQHIHNVLPNSPACPAASVCSSKSVENKPRQPDKRLKRIKNPFVLRANKIELNKSNANPKQGPFFKQQQKLDKVKRIENKKQKSKKALTKRQTSIDIVDLVSSDESDSSDVIMIPIPPPPTYSIDDSDDGEKVTSKTNDASILEEDALDSTDVQLSMSSSFVKPQQMSIQSLATASGCEDKRLENSSRCTSPCSIQSSDDFIGQTDRTRLLKPGSGMADDEDLLLLTSDVNSLLETPQSGQRDNGEKIKPLDTSTHNVDPNDSQNFATPATSSALRKSDYRVEGQFRAIDVYESESDITDSVYSKGTPKTTVIRQVDTSSEEDITCLTPRTKRLRKRRRSSGTKSSDANNENNNASSGDTNGDDDENECNSGAERTGIPFISRGPAVEQKVRKRSRTLSTCSPHMTPGRNSKSNHMSDGDFIAKLKDLVQCQDSDEVDDSDENENAPSAREIAEKILGEPAVTAPKETAVPNNICNKLTDVFETIDHLEDTEKEESLNRQEPNVNNFNTLNAGQRRAVVYRSLPEEDNAQILTFVDDPSPSVSGTTFMRKYAPNGSPIYNVVYSRGKKLGGGLGWNDEMRKFYQDSWNGEGFVLSEIWKKMNPDRNLWKIYNEDRYNKQNKRHNNLKCTNCCDFGHARYQCKRPMKPRICYMCGESGHQEPRCPNTICLRCGNKTQVFVKGCNACSFQNRLICPICKIRGHSIDHCPDKWRRYHSTTEPNAFPNNTIEYNPRKYCSICGNRGHLADSCRNAMNFMEYPAIATAVKSHQKSYNDMAVKSPFGSVGINLMYEPCLNYSFDMSQRTSTDKYYGRFLNAVGMGFLMTRKRSMSPQPATHSSAKKSRNVSKRSGPKPFVVNAPNQVQEISESGSVNNGSSKELVSEPSAKEIVESTVPDGDIQFNVVNLATPAPSSFPNFKPPNKVTTTNNSPQIMDSDSNYSFSEHFDDVPSTSNVSNKKDSYEMLKENPLQSAVSRLLASKEKPKSREMETLPEFIPLVDSTGVCDNGNSERTEPGGGDGLRIGISRRFVVAESDDENKDNREQAPFIAGLPCEAKIYLTHLHSKYLLSPDGRNFLTKSSKSCQLKARLDFTSVGHVLVIFGLPDNQDKFQRELLMKYRELSGHINSKQLQPTPNVPKRTDVLIRFLRDDLNQLLSNLGNVNHLFKRLQYVERQQSKSGFKLADKIRRSLNMILVGQAGLQEGNMHLDKLMAGLKTLMNDYSAEDVTPLSLRSEITAHWKVIFSSYRHDNYQDLVENYNNLISKNRMPKIIIDPLLLGHKVLDTSLTEEQREKLEQPKHSSDATLNCEQAKLPVTNILTPKHSKQNKRKQSLGAHNSQNSPVPSSKVKISNAVMSPAKTTSTQIIRADNSNVTTPIKNKSTANGSSVTSVSVSKKQQHKMMPPPPFANPEKRSTVTELSDKWKTTCDTILTEISGKSCQRKGNNPVRDSKLPSTFWSRESMRYLNECVLIIESRPELMEKIIRVQNKSKNGQLSYNDYLAVIKLHTALKGK